MPRALFVWLHRWAGLAMTGFLIVVGLTGSLLAFWGEIEPLADAGTLSRPTRWDRT